MIKYFTPTLPEYKDYYILKNGEKFEYCCVLKGQIVINNFFPLHEMHDPLILEILKFEFGADSLKRKLFKLVGILE